MLQVIRSKANSYVIKILFALLAATFALWGIGDVFRNWGIDTTVAHVGSKTISADDLNQALQNQLAQLRSMLNSNIDLDQAKQMGLVDATLQRLVGSNLVDLETARLNLVVGDDTIRQAILQDPNFRGPTGAFDRNTYTQILAANHLTQTQYEASMRANLVRNQLTGAIADGMTPPALLTETLYRAQGERRTADTVTLTPASATATIPAPTEEQLVAFHAAHEDLFRTPELRGVTIGLLRIDDVAASIKIPDDKLKAEYQARGDEFQTPEQRALRQMLLPTETAAKTTKAALDGGKDFLAVAKAQANADASSVDLGWVKRGDLPDQLADVAFGLAKGGSSAPVQTSFGWHILMVTDIKPATTQAFETVKEKLAQEVARDAAGDQIAKTANDIDDALAGGATFDAVAKKFGLKTQVVTSVDTQGHDADGKQVDLPQPADVVLHAVFTGNAGDTSSLNELGDDGYFLAHIDRVSPAVVKPLADVHAQAVTLWQADQKKQALAKIAQSLVDDVNSGKSLKDAAASRKLTVATTQPLQRTGAGATIPPALVAALFGAKEGGAVSAADGDNVVVGQVKNIEPADPAKDPAAVKAMSNQLSNAMKDDMLGAFDHALRGQFPVEVNQANIDRLL